MCFRSWQVPEPMLPSTTTVNGLWLGPESFWFSWLVLPGILCVVSLSVKIARATKNTREIWNYRSSFSQKVVTSENSKKIRQFVVCQKTVGKGIRKFVKTLRSIFNSNKDSKILCQNRQSQIFLLKSYEIEWKWELIHLFSWMDPSLKIWRSYESRLILMDAWIGCFAI